MGKCCSKYGAKTSAKVKEVLTEFKKQRELLSKILMFDLNCGKNPVLTICKRLARENTNDLGDTLHITTANIILVEFKKFMFLTALRL